MHFPYCCESSIVDAFRLGTSLNMQTQIELDASSRGRARFRQTFELIISFEVPVLGTHDMDLKDAPESFIERNHSKVSVVSNIVYLVAKSGSTV